MPIPSAEHRRVLYGPGTEECDRIGDRHALSETEAIRGTDLLRIAAAAEAWRGGESDRNLDPGMEIFHLPFREDGHESLLGKKS